MIGRLVQDPTLRHTQSGVAVADFSIANNRVYKANNEKKEDTSFFRCIAWNKLGETICQYCSKGQKVGIEGRLQQRSWIDQNNQKRYIIEIVIEGVQFLSTSQGRGQPSPGNGASPAPASSPAAGDDYSGAAGPAGDLFSDDDIPF